MLRRRAEDGEAACQEQELQNSRISALSEWARPEAGRFSKAFLRYHDFNGKDPSATCSCPRSAPASVPILKIRRCARLASRPGVNAPPIAYTAAHNMSGADGPYSLSVPRPCATVARTLERPRGGACS
ncbi:hypothetical protein MPC4_230043 [Methylocella tundrae]|uniref:Uncharacterized protein n=1 Tax=Methylocella tundrae TaxID=227605 RepID=A0A8B6M6C4_METTU|nr:hypothetical protein MPC4_230043 [Methylocella tundrae]